MRSVLDNIKTIVSIVTAVYTSTETGATVDSKGFNSGKAVIQVGDLDLADADETYNFKIQDSPDDSVWADVSGATGAATADDDTVQIRLEGLGTTVDRYIRVVATLAGTTPSCPMSAVFELGRAFKRSPQ